MRRAFVSLVVLSAVVAASPTIAQQTPAVPSTTTQPPPAGPSTFVTSQQTPPPSSRPAVNVEPVLPPRAPALPTVTANVKLDLTITDTYTGAPVKKTVSMLVLNGSNGMIRTSNRLANGSQVGLNIDAAAMIHQGGLITVRITFEYTPAQTSVATVNSREDMDALRAQQAQKGLSPTSQPAELHESISVVLQDGKPLLVSQSADPTTDRKVTVEVVAVILK